MDDELLEKNNCRIMIEARRHENELDEFGRYTDIPLPPVTDEEYGEILGTVKVLGKYLLNGFVKPEKDKKHYDDGYLQLLAVEHEYSRLEANDRNSMEFFDDKTHIKYYVYCPQNPFDKDPDCAYREMYWSNRFLNRIYPNWSFTLDDRFSFGPWHEYLPDYAKDINELMTANPNMSVKEAEEICSKKHKNASCND